MKLMIPLALIVLLILWMWAISRVLQKEQNHLWLWGLVLLPPIAIPLYCFNALFDDFIEKIIEKNAADKSFAELEELVKEHPSIARREELVTRYFDKGETAKALLQLKEMLDHDAENPEWQALAGLCLHREGRANDAVPFLEYAVSERPKLFDGAAAALLLDVYKDTQRTDDAEALCRRLGKQLVGTSFQVAQARYLLHVGNKEEASRVAADFLSRMEEVPSSKERRELQKQAQAMVQANG